MQLPTFLKRKLWNLGLTAEKRTELSDVITADADIFHVDTLKGIVVFKLPTQNGATTYLETNNPFQAKTLQKGDKVKVDYTVRYEITRDYPPNYFVRKTQVSKTSNGYEVLSVKKV